MAKKIEVINIEISSGLSPMHNDTMIKFVYAMLGELQTFWHKQSTQHFTIRINGEIVENYKK